MGGADGAPGHQVVGTSFTVWAPERARGPRGRQLQLLGRPPPRHARARFLGHLGDLHPRRRGGRGLQVRAAQREPRVEDEGRPDGTLPRDSAGDRLHRRRIGPRVERRGMDGPPQAHRPARRPGQHLRGPCRQLEEGHRQLPRAGGRARGLRGQQEGFTHVEFMPLAEHPFSRLVGISGDRLLRRGLPTRQSGRLQVPGGQVPPVPASASSWTGCPLTSRRTTSRSARFDGTPLYEDPDPLRGEHPDWGTYVFNFGTPRGAQLPGRQRPASGSTNTTSTRCAWTRCPRCCTWTTAASPASGARTSTEVARTSKPSTSSRKPTPPRTRTTPAS